MTGRTTTAQSNRDALASIRRRLALHRRSVSAALAFTAVLTGLTAITRAPELPAPQTGTGDVTRSVAASDAQLAVPLRLADPTVAGLLSVGDVVDVMVADQRGSATLVAADLTVTAIPGASGSGPWAEGDGVVMVGATEDLALALAGAAARGPVTVAVHR